LKKRGKRGGANIIIVREEKKKERKKFLGPAREGETITKAPRMKGKGKKEQLRGKKRRERLSAAGDFQGGRGKSSSLELKRDEGEAPI